MRASDVFQNREREAVRQAVHEAELLTSGEIRVFIEDECKDDVLDRASFVFAELEMQNTEQRNGVLIYLAVQDHKFAIIGDAGIHAKVGGQFWNQVKDRMLEHFKGGQLLDGILYGVREAGIRLQEYFPRQHDDSNELPNDLIMGGEGTK